MDRERMSRLVRMLAICLICLGWSGQGMRTRAWAGNTMAMRPMDPMTVMAADEIQAAVRGFVTAVNTCDIDTVYIKDCASRFWSRTLELGPVFRSAVARNSLLARFNPPGLGLGVLPSECLVVTEMGECMNFADTSVTLFDFPMTGEDRPLLARRLLEAALISLEFDRENPLLEVAVLRGIADLKLAVELRLQKRHMTLAERLRLYEKIGRNFGVWFPNAVGTVERATFDSTLSIAEPSVRLTDRGPELTFTVFASRGVMTDPGDELTEFEFLYTGREFRRISARRLIVWPASSDALPTWYNSTFGPE